MCSDREGTIPVQDNGFVMVQYISVRASTYISDRPFRLHMWKFPLMYVLINRFTKRLTHDKTSIFDFFWKSLICLGDYSTKCREQALVGVPI